MLSQVIEDALRQALAPRAEPTRRRVSVPTSPGRPLPGVNLDDNAGLLDLMDSSQCSSATSASFVRSRAEQCFES